MNNWIYRTDTQTGIFSQFFITVWFYVNVGVSDFKLLIENAINSDELYNVCLYSLADSYRVAVVVVVISKIKL